jgi:hypothetical protein
MLQEVKQNDQCLVHQAQWHLFAFSTQLFIVEGGQVFHPVAWRKSSLFHLSYACASAAQLAFSAGPTVYDQNAFKIIRT